MHLRHPLTALFSADFGEFSGSAFWKWVEIPITLTHKLTHTHTQAYIQNSTRYYRVAKTHRMLVLLRLFSAKEPLIIGLVPSFTTNIHALCICGEWRYGVWGRFQQESPIISGSFAERDLLVCVSAALYICGEWRYGWLLTFFWDMSFWSRAFGQERGLRSFSAKEPYN